MKIIAKIICLLCLSYALVWLTDFIFHDNGDQWENSLLLAFPFIIVVLYQEYRKMKRS